MTTEEIKRNLVEFARKWSLYDGTERAEAQTFLNELFAAYGQDRYEVGARSRRRKPVASWTSSDRGLASSR